MNPPGFELSPEVGRLPSRQLGGVSQPVSHRAEHVQSELNALVVAVIDVIMHACFERIKAVGCYKMEILGLQGA